MGPDLGAVRGIQIPRADQRGQSISRLGDGVQLAANPGLQKFEAQVGAVPQQFKGAYPAAEERDQQNSAPAVEPVPQREGEPKPEMNGVKKSDGAILPSKRANKGTGVPAEPVEGRASAKGNPRSESTRRTQSRESVTQAAGRIRQAATRKPQEKLTAPLHHVTLDALRWAFHALKRDAAAGVER